MNKNKIFRIAMAALLVVLSIAGTSMAYFTDVEEETNVFTAGNVNIELSYVGNNEISGVYPGQVIKRHATVSNIGSEAAYVGAIISLTHASNNIADIVNPTGDEKDIPVKFTKFFTDLVSGDDYIVKYATATPEYGFVFYIIKKSALNGKTDITDSVVLFENLSIPTTWDNEQMDLFDGIKLNIKAYATQTQTFENAEKAITTAFGDAWGGYNSATPLS